MPQKNKPRIGTTHIYAVAAVLFMAFALSSGMVGFLLGKGAAKSTGKLVDTIVLSPGESAVSSADELKYLSGRLLHSGGTPFVGAQLKLKSTGKTATTDEQGKFSFSGLRDGDHTITVQDSDGTELTELYLSLSLSGATVSADFGDSPTITLTEDAKMLEFTLTMGDDGSITLEEKGAYFVTESGRLADFDGGALNLENSTVAVTPVGTVIDSTGRVMLPNREVVLLPNGTQEEVTPGEEVSPSIGVDEDGSTKLEGGVTITPDGDVELPDGEILPPADNVIIITDDDVEELPELPDEYVPPQADSADDEETVEASPTPTPEATDSPEYDEPADGDEVAIAPTEPPTPTPEPTPAEKYRGIDVIDRETGLSWKQQSFIDLFKNREETADLSGSTLLAQPGTSGYYQFRLENPEDFDIVYTVSLKELSFHLPMRFSVVNERNNYSYLYRERTSEDGSAISTEEIIIPAGTVQNFRIDWEWPYEDWFRPKKDDVLDTEAAKQETDEERTYVLSVLIEATQIVKEPEIELDGEIRYPGIH